MNRRLLLTSAMLCMGALVWRPATADAPSQLLGEWTAPCEFFGTPARCDLKWKPGAHPSLIEMHYTVRADDGEKGPLFSGRSTLKQSGETLNGYWADSNGSIHPVFARANQTGVETHWGQASTERGRSVYQLTDAGGLEVTDWVLTDAGWQTFMRVVYARQ